MLPENLMSYKGAAGKAFSAHMPVLLMPTGLQFTD